MQRLFYKYAFCCADGYFAVFLILCSPAKNWPVLNHFLLWGDSFGVSLIKYFEHSGQSPCTLRMKYLKLFYFSCFSLSDNFNFTTCPHELCKDANSWLIESYKKCLSLWACHIAASSSKDYMAGVWRCAASCRNTLVSSLQQYVGHHQQYVDLGIISTGESPPYWASADFTTFMSGTALMDSSTSKETGWPPGVWEEVKEEAYTFQTLPDICYWNISLCPKGNIDRNPHRQSNARDDYVILNTLSFIRELVFSSDRERHFSVNTHPAHEKMFRPELSKSVLHHIAFQCSNIKFCEDLSCSHLNMC